MKGIIILLLLILSAGSFAVPSRGGPSRLPCDVKFEFRYVPPVDGNTGNKINLNDVNSLRQVVKKDSSNPVYEFALGAALVGRAYFNVMPKTPLTAGQLSAVIKGSKTRGDQKGLLSEAQIHLDKVIEGGANEFPQACLVRGVMYMLKGDFSAALADFYSSMDSDVENPMAANAAYIMLSFMWNDLSEEQQKTWGAQIAGRMAERLSMSGNQNADAYDMASRLYRESGELEKALGVAEMGLGVDPSNPKLQGLKSEVNTELSGR